MWIKMRQTARGCEDGYVVRNYIVGEYYDVGEMLAREFFKHGQALPAPEKESKNG